MLQLKLLAVVLDHVGHVVHHSLNAITALLHLQLASPLFLQGHLHVQFDLLSLLLLNGLHLGEALLLLLHVLFDHAHCSLTFLQFFVGLPVLFFFDLLSQSCHSLLFFILAPQLLLDLLLLGLLEHLISLLLSLNDLLLHVLFLFALNLKLLSRLFKDAFIEVFLLLDGLLTQHLPHLDLLIEHIADFFLAIFFLLLQLFLLLLVETLTELLNFAPFVVADVRRHILNLNGASITRHPAGLVPTYPVIGPASPHD